MTEEIPNRIFSFWMQGVDEAPEIVKFNWTRWRELNPEFDVTILDMRTSEEYMASIPINLNDLAPQTYADILRYILLHTHGGIWVDSTVFPVRPLREWLPRVMGNSSFFTFSYPGTYDRLLDNWFLAARLNSKIMDKWLQACLHYWSRKRKMLEKGEIPDGDPLQILKSTRDGGGLEGRYQYFWSHNIFAELVEKDSDFAREWSAMTKIPTGPATAMQWYFLRNEQVMRSILLRALPALNRAKLKRYSRGAPVHKLNWRKTYPIGLLKEL